MASLIPLLIFIQNTYSLMSSEICLKVRCKFLPEINIPPAVYNYIEEILFDKPKKKLPSKARANKYKYFPG